MDHDLADVSLPSVPPELLSEIFSHCGPDTLAVACWLSSACLELASPRLYEDVTIKDDLSLAMLLRVPHPLSHPALDPSDPAFKANYPRGFPVPPLPSPTRLSPYTSRTLIHSLTYTGLSHGHRRPLDYLISLSPSTLPARLALPVLHISLPPLPPHSLHARTGFVSNIARMMALLDPETLIATERYPTVADLPVHDPTAMSLSNELRLWSYKSNTDWTPQRPWTRLKTVVEGKKVGLHRLGACIQPRADGPIPCVRYIVDLRSSRSCSGSDVADGFDQVRSDLYEDVVYDYPDERDPDTERLDVRAWVGIEEIRRIVLDTPKDERSCSVDVPEESVVVPSERVVARMEELRFAGHGRRRGMDRRALAEVIAR